MGLFRKKKKENSINPEEFRWLTVEEALSLSRGEKPVNEDTVVQILEEIVEQSKNNERLGSDTKFEYEEVIRHIADIQRLEGLSERDFATVTDNARLIVNLENQRAAYQQNERKLSPEHYRVMEMYEEEIPKQLRVMEEREKYLMLINNDMRQIEGEKGSIKYEKELASSKRKFLTKFTYIAIVAVITLFILFFVLADYTGKDMTLCFLVTGALACAYAAYYVITVKKCSEISKRSDIMLNRAVEIGNKVKIKLVNTTNALDYSYEKFHCNSHQELAYFWQQYVKEKEEEQHYRKNSQLLVATQNSLIEILEGFGFEIPDIWAHQAETLINRGDMADLKDVLDTRRRKLRAQLDYTMKQKKNLAAEIENLYSKYPQYDRLISRYENLLNNT